MVAKLNVVGDRVFQLKKLVVTAAYADFLSFEDGEKVVTEAALYFNNIDFRSCRRRVLLLGHDPKVLDFLNEEISKKDLFPTDGEQNLTSEEVKRVLESTLKRLEDQEKV